MKVLITTSGIGSRLGSLTDFTNKCLVRIGDRPSISHIIDHYPISTSFVITLGHFGSYVKQFLEMAYPEREFHFVWVDNFQGEGSSLCYSILQAKDNLQCPFIFHASDTLLGHEEEISCPEFNWCAGAYKKESAQYRTVIVNKDPCGGRFISVINEKGEIHFDYSYIGLCGIKDYKDFWTCLEEVYSGDPFNASLSDVHVINKMIKSKPFKFQQVDKWIDVGNTNELFSARKEFKSNLEVLDKEREAIYLLKGSVIKFFSDPAISKNRVIRASSLAGLVPKITASAENFYRYERVEGDTFSNTVDEQKFLSFLDWAKTNLWIHKEAKGFSKQCYDFYISKTKTRIDEYLRDKEDLSGYINGVEIPPAKSMLEKIDTDWLCDGLPVQFHGDFILDNVIESEGEFCLIDWRQDFAGNLEAGDIYYDLSKLNHNLIINHGLIKRGLYNSESNNCHVLCNSLLIRCREILHDFIVKNGYDLKKVELLSAIIWINMAPLHEYPFNDFLFNFGKHNLYKNMR
ncbi:hypothetical protein CL634_02500 [bacterium]|nr:hypothetical protein [bacterium]